MKQVNGSSWLVYIVQCADGTLYTGSTTDVSKRIATHNAGAGAKYTRSRLPVTLCFTETCTDKSQAFKLEAQIKKLNRKQKIARMKTIQ